MCQILDRNSSYLCEGFFFPEAANVSRAKTKGSARARLVALIKRAEHLSADTTRSDRFGAFVLLWTPDYQSPPYLVRLKQAEEGRLPQFRPNK